jgi:hypothetical protein
MRYGDGEVDTEDSSHSSYSIVDCLIRKDSSLYVSRLMSKSAG